jgi:hypothetical protein
MRLHESIPTEAPQRPAFKKLRRVIRLIRILIPGQ